MLFLLSLLSSNGGNGRLCQVLDDYLTFIRNNSEKLYYSGQDTDKKAREALLLLETQRKEQQFDSMDNCAKEDFIPLKKW